jgi:hypothetical protein
MSAPFRLVHALVGTLALSTAAPQTTGWTPLFNGTDLAGWTNINCAPETFSVRDGMIHSTGAPICEIRTERMYENFELELEYQHLKAGGNAGVFVWADAMPAKGQPFLRAIEVQVLDGRETANYTSHGDIFPIHGAVMTPDRPHPGGWMRSLPREKRAKPAGEWNHYRIVANRGAISLAVNGQVVTEGSGASPRKGYIALESEGSPTLFRNLRIRELPADAALTHAQIAVPDEGFTSLYTGVDLRGWTVADADRTKWTAKDWTLVAAPDAGPLTTAQRFTGNVVVRYDWRVPEGTTLPARGLPPPEPTLDPAELRLSAGPAGEAGTWHRTEIAITGDTYVLRIDDRTATRGASVRGAGSASQPSGSTAMPGRRLVLRGGPVPIEFANIFVKADTVAPGGHAHHD